MEYSQGEMRMLSIAIIVILLSAFAIVAFALGSMAIFYLLAIIAIVMGFYLAYYASIESKAEQKAGAKKEKGKRRV
ncbi:MAG: hypothetical protein ACP5T3_00600 [Candidatus Micrarchaeia archaeon]